MWDFNQPYFEGKLIPTDQAWRKLDEWQAAGTKIGVWFMAKSGSVRTLGTVQSVRNGRLEMSGGTVRAGFNLKDATFLYAPVQFYPRWPLGPIVEVMALQAAFPTGDWLMLAEGGGPEGLPMRELRA